MDDNRYSPPKAPVADVAPEPARRQRPGQVVLAIQLAAATFAVGLIVMFLSWDYYARLQPVAATVFTQVFGLILSVWIYSKIYAGRNWARIFLLVSSVLGLLVIFSGTFAQMMETAPLLVKVWLFLSPGTTLAILLLIFLPPGRDWFRKA